MTGKASKMQDTHLIIMDTTLRDGEQTSGVSFSDGEKVNVAKVLLENVKVDRIEIASARVSEGEFRGTKQVMQWAAQKGHLDKVEILGFVDNRISLQWIADAGGKVGWYVRNSEVLESLRAEARNPRYLSDVEFDPARIDPSDDINRVVAEADVVILAAPSAFIKSFLEGLV